MTPQTVKKNCQDLIIKISFSITD